MYDKLRLLHYIENLEGRSPRRPEEYIVLVAEEPVNMEDFKEDGFHLESSIEIEAMGGERLPVTLPTGVILSRI